MKLEEQVLTIEQMNHIKELGVEVKDTALAWVNARVGHNFVAPISLIFHDDYIPTLTLQEILEMLPEEIKRGNDRIFLIVNKADRSISYMSKDYHGRLDSVCITADGGENFLTDAYYMLCWVLEYGYLNASKSMPLA